MLRDFLLLNPDCAGPVQDLEDWVLGIHEVSFPQREKLKKDLPDSDTELTDANFDLFSIARLEKDLSPEQEKAHADVVAGDEKRRQEWEAWKETILVPAQVSFPGKKRLKKNTGISRRVICMGVMGAAAAVALLVTLMRVDPDNVDILEPDRHRESAILEDHPEEGVFEEITAREDPSVQEEIPGPTQESIELASEPVTLSIKKNPDPPELTGRGMGKNQSEQSLRKESLPQVESRDSVTRAGSRNRMPERIRIAGLTHATLNMVNEGQYDRITPLDLPPGSIHLTSLSIYQLSDIDLQQIFDDFTEENELSIWSIANSGIRGFNRITGADISLLAHQDSEGDISGIQFRSRRFSLSAPLNREE